MANPNPNLANLKPFKKGDVGNPSGLTKEMSARIRATAEKIAKLQEIKANALLKVAEDMVAKGEDAGIVANLIKAEINGFERDVMDRAYGKAGQQLDLLSSDGSMSPRHDESEAVLEALRRKHATDAG